MANSPSSSFESTFGHSLHEYKKRTGNDLFSHPLAFRLQTCESPRAIISVLQEQVRAIDQSGSGDESLTKWLSPTVNFLVALSAIQQDVGLVIAPAKLIFVGIGVLLSTAKAVRVGASQDRLIDILGRLGEIFQQLEHKVALPGSRKDINEMILLELFSILASVTKEITQGRAKKYWKKLIGRNVVEDALRRLDDLARVMESGPTFSERIIMPP
ncbi:hypothetical protein DFH94DRAFT_678273 [Russula ochroleuca]|uniref:Fungal STAND N-terminal Goodbye domain-containing protein n=1 Tax=Russula ochroleuca TaxID=152965 RepID=A0A9P5N5S0_9AGAM|nr:hypothetical protein DFH94DRAFT_678273 [Russula ochroleuca]